MFELNESLPHCDCLRSVSHYLLHEHFRVFEFVDLGAEEREAHETSAVLGTTVEHLFKSGKRLFLELKAIVRGCDPTSGDVLAIDCIHWWILDVLEVLEALPESPPTHVLCSQTSFVLQVIDDFLESVAAANAGEVEQGAGQEVVQMLTHPQFVEQFQRLDGLVPERVKDLKHVLKFLPLLLTEKALVLCLPLHVMLLIIEGSPAVEQEQVHELLLGEFVWVVVG